MHRSLTWKSVSCFVPRTVLRKEAFFFGLTEGEQCWCGTAYEGEVVTDAKCDKPCSDSDREMCGGISASSVYIMHDCETPPVHDDKMQYDIFEGETCSDGSPVEVGGQKKMQGSVEDCKRACWHGSTGSENCHGFTYQSRIETCSFYVDVLDGEVTKARDATCYFKKV